MVAHSSLTPEHDFATELKSRLDPPNARNALQPRLCPGHGQPGNPQTARDTHFHTFRSQEDFGTIIRTSALLEESGFYWGPLPVSAAHEKLKGQPVGTFLLRDSRQKNCFFAISVKTATGPTSIRVVFHAGRFSFHGGNETFACLFELLEYYAGPPRRMLGRPLRKRPLRSLQELCRKSILVAAGRENLNPLPLNPVLKDYLQTFPFAF